MLWSAVRARQWALHFDRPISCPRGGWWAFFKPTKLIVKPGLLIVIHRPGPGPDLAPIQAHSRPGMDSEVRALAGLPSRIEGDKGPGMWIHLEIMRITLGHI